VILLFRNKKMALYNSLFLEGMKEPAVKGVARRGRLSPASE
jgi:hypothetical protein